VRASRIEDDLSILPLVLISGQRDHIANVQLLSGPGRVLAYEVHPQHREPTALATFVRVLPVY
jgi:hypothetical protein